MAKNSGLINSTDAPDEDDGAPDQSGHDLLASVEQKIESQLTPQNRANYMKIVTAGMAVGLQGGPKSILASLAKSKDPVQDAAKGAVNLCLILQHRSRGTMPIKAMIPAATTLMLKALDFADRAGIVKVDTDVINKATRLIVNFVMAKSGITPTMLHTAAQKVHSMINDPAALEKIKRAAGTVRDPMASTPTDLSGAQ